MQEEKRRTAIMAGKRYAVHFLVHNFVSSLIAGVSWINCLTFLLLFVPLMALFVCYLLDRLPTWPILNPVFGLLFPLLGTVSVCVFINEMRRIQTCNRMGKEWQKVWLLGEKIRRELADQFQERTDSYDITGRCDALQLSYDSVFLLGENTNDIDYRSADVKLDAYFKDEDLQWSKDAFNME